MTSEILRFSEKPVIDESIQEYEYHEYETQARTNLNSAGEININIELQDLFTHPAESYIFEGRLTKTDGAAYANADAVALTNNGLMYLFSNISYRLFSQEIQSVHYPGQATMLGLLTIFREPKASINCGKRIWLLLRLYEIIRVLTQYKHILSHRPPLRVPSHLEPAETYFRFLRRL